MKSSLKLCMIISNMEQSVSDNEIQQPLSSPPRRRRSTFFDRRDSIVPQQKEDTKRNEKHKEDLQCYYNKLLAEKEQWKKEVNNRTKTYRDLRLQYEMLVKTPSSSMSYSTLFNEDIEFLKGKVSISNLVETQAKVHKSVKETQALFRRAAELENSILSYCEDKVNKITDYILDNSTVENIE